MDLGQGKLPAARQILVLPMHAMSFCERSRNRSPTNATLLRRPRNTGIHACAPSGLLACRLSEKQAGTCWRTDWKSVFRLPKIKTVLKYFVPWQKKPWIKTALNWT